MKREPAKLPTLDAIFLETVVQFYFFIFVQWARFALWLAGAE